MEKKIIKRECRGCGHEFETDDEDTYMCHICRYSYMTGCARKLNELIGKK
jgi:hypothetical protein